MRTAILAIATAVLGCGPPDRGPGDDTEGDCTGIVLACRPEAARATPVVGVGTGAVALLHVSAMDDRYALGWYEGLGPAFAGIADARGVLESHVELSPIGLFPHVAWNGAEIGAVYFDDLAPDSRRLVFVRLDARARIIDGSRITLESVYGQGPTIAWSPVAREWAIVWQELESYSGSTNKVKLTRVDEHGRIVPGSTRVLSDPDQYAGTGDGGGALVWANGVWATAWPELWHRVRFARLDATGELLGITTIADAVENVWHPTVASGCDGFAVAFTHAPVGSDLFVTRYVPLDRDGVPVPGEHTFAFPDAHATQPSVVWTGTHYRIVYGEATSSTAKLWAADLTPGAVSNVRSLDDDGWFPHAIWDGCRMVVAYSDESSQERGRLLFEP